MVVKDRLLSEQPDSSVVPHNDKAIPFRGIRREFRALERRRAPYEHQSADNALR